MTLVWRPGNNAITDPDALIYIDKVEKADGQNLEYDVAKAINDFVVGCKTDGIWSAIKASCILAGARTLTGALIPLVGTAPTNNNFVSGDYNRKTGLVGNGSTKYLNSNRNNNADPQDSRHVSVFSTSQGTGAHYYAGAGQVQNGATIITRPSASQSIWRLSSAASVNDAPLANGLNAISRSTGSTVSIRNSGASLSISNASAAPVNGNLFVFGANDSGLVAATDARLAFYSIGESLDLAKLDTRVSALITAFQAPGVIP